MNRRNAGWILIVAGALGLAACGGSGGVTITPPGPPDSFAVTSGGRLVGFNLTTPGAFTASYSISGLAAGETVLGVAYRPFNGLLYGLTTTARIVTLNTTTGAATVVSTLAADAADITAPFTALSGARFGLDFNPVPDRLRVVSDTGQNLRINVDSGATTTDTNLNGSAAAASGAAYTNAFTAACRTQLFVIDPVTDRLYLQNPPNDGVLTPVGALGIDVASVGGFDVATASDGTNTAYAALAAASGATTFYTINTSTGAATAGGTFVLNSGESLIGYATQPLSATATAPTQVAGELIGLTTANGLVTFQRGSPAKLCTSGAVTGLPASTNLLGIDVRPATGALIGLGSDAALYTLTTAGAATSLCTLAPDPADVTAPYAGLSGSNFGVGFNPVPDRLRVVSESNQNLRINPTPSSGVCLVTSDTDVSGGTVTGAGYTNAFPGAGTTTLFALDGTADTLVRIGNDPANGIAGDPGNPNSGVVTSIGALGVDIGPANGLVIDGRLNTAFAALTVGAATTSNLYTLNLATGAATSVGTIGGGTALRGLALTGGTTVTVYALTADGHLLSFSPVNNVLTPNTVTDVTISGLAGGETLVGADIRPANGQLYGLSTLGKVYTISTTTGAVTLASTLIADAADTTLPFSALTAGANYGIDFNPVPDRLRVVDSAGNSLRINVMTGATTTDTGLTGNLGPVVAAAYTNSFAGAATTTLYDLDSTTLYLQGSVGGTPVSPNAGVLTAVGALGVTAVGDIGYSIGGGANGLSLAAIRTTAGVGPSDLYRVNLATGVAMPISATPGVATIGTGSTTQVLSLAVDIR